MAMVVTTCLLTIIFTSIIADQTIHRAFFKLDRDVTSLEVGSSITVELTFIDSNAAESTLEIETEKRVHDCCLEITKKPHLRLYLKQNQPNYPKVTAHLRLRKPLVYINLNQAANLVMHNVLKTDKFFVELFQATRAQMKIQITSYLYISLSDDAKMNLHGFVNDTAKIHLRKATKLDARCCHISKASVHVSGAGLAEFSSVKSLSTTTSEYGQVRYDNSTKFIDLFDFNWIKKKCDPNRATARTLDRSVNYFSVLFFTVYFVWF